MSRIGALSLLAILCGVMDESRRLSRLSAEKISADLGLPISEINPPNVVNDLEPDIGQPAFFTGTTKDGRPYHGTINPQLSDPSDPTSQINPIVEAHFTYDDSDSESDTITAAELASA